MNALCAFCPFNWFCSDDDESKLRRENYELREEKLILQERLLDNGLEAGASILATGQRRES